MTRFITSLFAFLIGFTTFAQTKNLSEYSYIVVPNQFDFQSGANQYELNEMAKFYFEKNGFNAYLNSDAPNANRCDGLYADVDRLRAFMGTKIQIVIRDCNKNEVYRGPEVTSKYKEFQKAYQDALRNAFSHFEILNVNQKEVVLIDDSQESIVETVVVHSDSDVSSKSDNGLPSSAYTSYTSNNESFVLRKTGEGYSLYKENSDGDMILQGKIIVIDTLIKFMDAGGNVSDAAFDDSGALIIGKDSSQAIYKQKN